MVSMTTFLWSQTTPTLFFWCNGEVLQNCNLQAHHIFFGPWFKNKIIAKDLILAQKTGKWEVQSPKQFLVHFVSNCETTNIFTCAEKKNYLS